MGPLGFFRYFNVRSDAKEEWGAESNRKLLHPFIPSKTATLVPEFAVEDLPLGRTATLVPDLPVKDLPLGRTATLVPEHPVKDLPLGRTLMILHYIILVEKGDWDFRISDLVKNPDELIYSITPGVNFS